MDKSPIADADQPALHQIESPRHLYSAGAFNRASSSRESSSTPEPAYDPDAPELAGPISSSDDLPPFPITHELALKDHTKVISALALDPSGARVLSGSHDYDCKLWDFGGMDARCKPFRSWEPAGSYYVRFLTSLSSQPSYHSSTIR